MNDTERHVRSAPRILVDCKAGTKVLSCFLLISGIALGVGQPAPAPYLVVPYEDLTVSVDIPHSAEARVASQTVGVDGAAWIIIRFESFDLGNNVLAIQSIEDPNQRQAFTQEKLTIWEGVSARFVGGMVRITVSGSDDRGRQSFDIKDVLVGRRGSADSGTGSSEALSPESLGSDDHRQTSYDDRIARVMPIGCTAFALNSGAFVTAGHCVTYQMIFLEFRVPPSLEDGTTLPPPIQHQFKIDRSSIVHKDNGPGDDWAVFEVHESDDGLMPDQIYGGFDFSTEAARGKVAVRGYGVDDGVDNQTQQHDYGDVLSYRMNTSNDPELIRHSAGTQPGNSGSPIFYIEASGKVVGIHTHGDEDRLDDVLENSGTSLTQIELYQAIARRGRGIVTEVTRSSVDSRLARGADTIDLLIDHNACFSRIYWWLLRARFVGDLFDPGEIIRIHGFSPHLVNTGSASQGDHAFYTIWPRDTNHALDGRVEVKLSSVVGSVHVSEMESEVVGHLIPCE